MRHPGDRPGDQAGSRAGTVRGLLPLLVLASLAVLTASLAAGAVIDEDTLISGTVEWSDAEYAISANVTVRSGGSLLVNGSDLVFDADGAVVGLLVEPGAQLTLRGVTATAAGDPYFISSDGTTTIEDSSLAGLFSTGDEDGLVGLVGGVVANAGTLTLRDVSIASDGVGLSAFDCDLVAEGLDLEGGQYGVLVVGSVARLTDVHVTDMFMGFVADDSTVEMVDCSALGVNWTMWAISCDVQVLRLDSRPLGDHLAFENGTASVVDSYFYDGQEGAVALLGYLEVVGCHFNSTRTAVELLYAEGRIVDTLVEDCADMAIVLSFIGYSSDEPRFELDNVTVRDSAEAAVEVEGSRDLLLSNLTVMGCGDGLNIATSSVILRDVLITGSTQCRPWGCSYTATGTGVLLETAAVDMFDVTIQGSNGPAVSAYFSSINATRSRFVDGNASGLLVVYSDLGLVDCQVSGNAQWGVESLGYDIDPGELDASWGNDLADIRMNMTINAKVQDQEGQWLSHAEVTASSRDLVVGPYLSGVFGSTPTYELAIVEWTDGPGTVDFNPWTFDVVYGNFTSSTDVDVVLGLGQITLVVEVRRADLVVRDLKAPKELDRDERATIGAVVANVGNETVDSVVLTFYYRNVDGFQRVIGEVRLGPLSPGESEKGQVEWAPDRRGDYTIVAVVDVDDRVDEEDDDNNRVQRELSVGDGTSAAPGPGAAMALTVLAAAGLVSVTTRRRRALTRPGRPGGP